MKKNKKEAAAFRKRILTIIGLCFVGVALVVCIILNASISKVYCVENSSDYQCDSGNCLDYIFCVQVGKTCSVCKDNKGLVCDGEYLECTWYPLFCGCEEKMPVCFGCNLCYGRTFEFGNEYPKTDKYKIERAINGEDYEIYSMVLSQNDARLGDYYDNFDWDEFWNMYSFNNYDDEFTVTVRFKNYVPLYFASVEMIVIGERDTATVIGYSGHTEEMVKDGSVYDGYILQPGEHIVYVNLTVGGFVGAGVGDVEKVEYNFSASTIEKE